MVFSKNPNTVAIQVYDGEGDLPEAVAKRKWRQANKLLTWPQGSWRYTGKCEDERGHVVRFCWSCHRNEAGYFFAWREVCIVANKSKTPLGKWDKFFVERGVQWLLKRYDVVGRRVKKRAKAFATRKAAGWEAAREKQRQAKARMVATKSKGG